MKQTTNSNDLNSQEGKVRQAIKFCSTIEPPPCRPSWRYKNGSDHHHLHHPLWNRDRLIASKAEQLLPAALAKQKEGGFYLHANHMHFCRVI